MEAHRDAGRPLRVIVSAFTHAAIENALRKINELQSSQKIVSGPLGVGKLNGIRGDAGASTVDVGRDAGDAWLADHPLAVLGGTAWAIRRLEVACADVVVLDEASQLRVPESTLAVRRLKHDGRLVVAGDDRQLPPIVQGAYPDPEDGEPLLHRSIFECLRTAPGSEAVTVTLLENWRMNATLCRYPAQQVYVSEYRPATEEIAKRQLAVGRGTHGWVDPLLEPDHPLVVCVLEGVQATAENRLEAALVGRRGVLVERSVHCEPAPRPDPSRASRARGPPDMAQPAVR
jgi:hypothetical protein